MSVGYLDESQRRSTRGLQTLHHGINALTWLARLNYIAAADYGDPFLVGVEVDALNQAIDLLQDVVLPALQLNVIETCDDDTRGDFRGHEAQSKDDEVPQLNADAALTRRRRRRGPHSRRRGPHNEILEMR
jgi:hypothetical protein